MPSFARRASIATAVLMVALPASPAQGARKGQPEKSEWLPDEIPLPLVVRTPADLAFKAAAERQYLVFNLLAGGKVAYDAGRFSEAADHWETLLQVPGLEPEIDRVVRPLAIDARQKAGQEPNLPPPPPEPKVEAEPVKKKAPRETVSVDVTGTIVGGGARGPGGAVVSLRRKDGKTPRPSPSGSFVVAQKGKQFVPHVLAIPVGATVSFRNDDSIFHNVFSTQKPEDFDLGLYKSGLAREHRFAKAGATQVFCNIHALMNMWIVALDTPWYAVADGAGRFTVKGLAPGEYAAEVWHELATTPTRTTVKVAPDMPPLRLSVAGDRRPIGAAPDKYGKQRQVQLGY